MPQPSLRKRNLAILGTALLLALFMALLNSGIIVSSELASRDRTHVERVLANEVTGTLCLLPLFPFLFWFMARYPLERGNWARRLPLHLLVIALYGACHTLLMWGSRTLLYRLLGWGEYDYGAMGFRFLMEYGKQFIGYWFVYAILRSIALARQSREREIHASRLEKELADARLETLRMQLNPHFLFNTLNMISSFIYENPRTAESMIARLSDLLRKTLSQVEKPEVPLREELNLLDSYLWIMKARFQERLEVSTPSVDSATANCLVPCLILQPLVENSVRHCTADPGRPGVVQVSAHREGNLLRLEVADNGPGITAEKEERNGAGIGLSNTRSRLAHLYGEAHRLQIENLPAGGLRITIEMPVRSAQSGKEADRCTFAY